MTETELSPPIPGRWRCFERRNQIPRWSDDALLRIESNLHIERFSPLKPSRFSMAPAQRNANRFSHGGDRAAIAVPVEGHADGCADFPERSFGIKWNRHDAHAAISDDCDANGLRGHRRNSQCAA